MRKFSRKFLLVEGKKYHLVSVKPPGEPWDDIGFFQKSQEKDEFGYMIKGEKLVCPHRSKLSIGNLPGLLGSSPNSKR